MRALLRVTSVLVLVGSSATAEPQEGDAYPDKERGICPGYQGMIWSLIWRRTFTRRVTWYGTAATTSNRGGELSSCFGAAVHTARW